MRPQRQAVFVPARLVLRREDRAPARREASLARRRAWLAGEPVPAPEEIEQDSRGESRERVTPGRELGCSPEAPPSDHEARGLPAGTAVSESQAKAFTTPCPGGAAEDDGASRPSRGGGTPAPSMPPVSERYLAGEDDRKVVEQRLAEKRRAVQQWW